MSPTNLNTPDYWDSIYRAEWDCGAARGGHYHRDYAPIHEAILGLIPEGGRVLDVGCGPGLLCRKIKRRQPTAEVLGVDFAPGRIAQNREQDRGLGLEYRCLDVRTGLASLDRTFDVVTLCEILEHLDQPGVVVAAALGLLRNGGCFVLTCPHDQEIPDPEHLRTWGHDEVFHLLAPYSDTVSFMHFPPPYYHKWMLAYLTKTQVAIRAETPK